MDNNDSNSKSQQTGGLKLMTVFIAVLALHVVVIGGFTVYHLMSGGSTDADLVSLDKTKKDTKSADGTSIANATATDASQSDKATPVTPSTTTSTDVATTPPAATSAPDVTGPNEIVPPTPGPAPVLKPTPVAPPVATTQPGATQPPLTMTPSELAQAAKLAPLAPLTSDLSPSAESAPLAPDATLTPSPLTSAVASGPVHMPPAAKAPSPNHVDAPTYTVKITDSYKKIASAHHVTVAQLKAANHIKGDTLHTGEKLIIPSSKTLVATAVPTSDTEVKPVTSSLIESAPAPTASLAAAPSYAGTTSSTHEHSYTIVKGDTLSKIAHKFKTSATAIMTENNITDPTKLTIGKKLKIPSKESRSAGNSVPVAAPLPPQVQPQIQPQPQPQVEAKSNDTTAQLANFKGSEDTNF